MVLSPEPSNGAAVDEPWRGQCDDVGWATGAVVALPPSAGITIFSPTADARMNPAMVERHAERFFDHRAAVGPTKSFETGTPRRDRYWVRLEANSSTARAASRWLPILTVPVEDAPALMTRARQAAVAMGGAGFDVLVERTRRIWQVAYDDGPDSWSWLVGALLCSVHLGPALLADGSRLVGTKGAREQFESLRRNESDA